MKDVRTSIWHSPRWDVLLSASTNARGFVRRSKPVSYKRHRFPPVIIAHAVRLYFRFALTQWLVEEMLLGRGIAVSYETVRR